MKDRRHFLKTIGSATAMSFLLPYLPISAHRQFEALHSGNWQDGFQIKNLRGNIGCFTERGGTIGWYAGPDGLAVIDTQFPEQAEHLMDALHEIKDGRVDVLINTHHHGDHTSGNSVIAQYTDHIVAHENSKVNQMASAEQRGNEDQQVYPNETYRDEYKAKVGNETILLKYFGAAHTNGDSLVHFENANIAHLGDLVFNRRFPYIDKSAGADVQNWIVVLDDILKHTDNETLYMWGHAGSGYEVTGSRADIQAFQNYLEKLVVFGQDQIKKGVSLEEAIEKTTVIPGAEEWSGKGIERSIKAIYQELNG